MMKKLLFFAAFAVFGLTMNAQEKTTKEDVNKATKAVEQEATKLYNQAKTGGFKVGVNIGLPIGDAGDYSKFDFGADIAWLWDIGNRIEVGGLLGYTHFIGDEISIDLGDNNEFKSSAKALISEKIEFDDFSFLPISTTARYFFDDTRKMFVGVDLGYAINMAGNADSGLYFRPKFGYNMGKINLVGSFQSISGDFSSLNAGVEIAF